MTDMLDRAFNQASKLPEDEQNEFAAFLMAELEAEQRWSDLLASSQDRLANLAKEAVREHESSDTRSFNPGKE